MELIIQFLLVSFAMAIILVSSFLILAKIASMLDINLSILKIWEWRIRPSGNKKVVFLEDYRKKKKLTNKKLKII